VVPVAMNRVHHMYKKKGQLLDNVYGNLFSMVPILVPKQAGNVNGKVFSIQTPT